MQFKITANTTAHDFDIGELVWATRPADPVDAADNWQDYCQVLMLGERGEAWWVCVTDFEVVS